MAHMLDGWIDFVQLAGADAPGYSITRVVKWLAVHPEWLDALGEEQHRLMQEYGDAIDRRVRTFCRRICHTGNNNSCWHRTVDSSCHEAYFTMFCPVMFRFATQAL